MPRANGSHFTEYTRIAFQWTLISGFHTCVSPVQARTTIGLAATGGTYVLAIPTHTIEILTSC